MYKIVITDYVTNPIIEQKVFGDKFQIICLNEEDEKLFSKEIEDADAILVWHARLTDHTFKKLKKCKVIIKYGTGYDNINVDQCKEFKIPFCNTPDYGVEEVADTATALILNSVRQIKYYDNISKEIKLGWQRGSELELRRTNRHKLGIIGCGRIGTAVSQRMKAFGLEIAFFDPYKPSGYEKSIGIKRFDSLEELVNFSSIITLHTPLNNDTIGLINKELIKKFNKNTIFVNTSRGPIVDSLNSLFFGLENNYISFLGLDVLPEEPPSENEKLIKTWKNNLKISNRIIISPHSAYYSLDSWPEMREKASQNLKNFIQNGALKNKLN